MMAICFVPGNGSRRLRDRRLRRAGTCRPSPDVGTSALALSGEVIEDQSATSDGPADRMSKHLSRCRSHRAVATG
jgi:hypothetical protein